MWINLISSCCIKRQTLVCPLKSLSSTQPSIPSSIPTIDDSPKEQILTTTVSWSIHLRTDVKQLMKLTPRCSQTWTCKHKMHQQPQRHPIFFWQLNALTTVPYRYRPGQCDGKCSQTAPLPTQRQPIDLNINQPKQSGADTKDSATQSFIRNGTSASHSQTWVTSSKGPRT